MRKHPDKNFIGKKFGNLEVIAIYKKDIYIFKCKCGSIIQRKIYPCISGKRKSCGCATDNTCLIGKKINNFRIIDAFYNKKYKQFYCHCICFCGKKFENIPLFKIKENIKICSCKK